MKMSIIQAYNDLIDKREVVYNQKQIELLEELAKFLKADKFSFLGKSKNKLFGIYIHGSVGCGKTTMMDIFFKYAHHKKKERHHFHSFVNQINNLIIEGKKKKYSDPMQYVFKYFSKLQLLCLDEFEILDVVTSVLIRRLLSYLIENQCIIITTSNTEPRNLYKNGLQREKFLEFIDFLETKVKIFHIEENTDYRRLNYENLEYISSHKFFQTKSIITENDFFFKFVLPSKNKSVNNIESLFEFYVDVNNRKIKILYFEDIAILDFNEFCCGNYGNNDYRGICKNFSTLALINIPDLEIEDLNSWKRFVWLIDEAYDAEISFLATGFFDYQFPDISNLKSKMPQIERAFSRFFELCKPSL